MDKIQLEQWVNEGKSIADISKLAGITKTPVCYWLRKHGLKTKRKRGEGWPKTRPTRRIQISDDRVKEMQAYYDNGGTYRGLLKKFSISCGPINRLIKEGRLKMRSLAEANAMATQLGRRSIFQTDEYRETMRSRVKKRLQEKPEQHPNRILAANRSRMSRPERRIYDELTRLQISFQHNGQIDGFFIDFLFPSFGIEIDGKRWHDPEKDRIRDARIYSHGVRIIRFDSQVAMKTPDIIIKTIQENLSLA